MKIFTKLMSLMIAFVVCFGCLTACSFGSGNNVQPDEINPDEYVAKVDIKFATNDDKLKSAVDAMNSSAEICAKDGNIYVVTSSGVNTTFAKREYTLIDGMLYCRTNVEVSGLSVTETKKAEMGAENADKLISDVGAGASVGIEDFYAVDVAMYGERTSYTCSDAFDETKLSLASILSDDFSAIGATVTVTDVEYTLETEGEVPMSSVLSCSYSINLGGETYEITMRLYTSYDYKTPVSIVLPEKAEEFKTVSYSEIVG